MVFELLREMIVEAHGCDGEEVTPMCELREDLGLSDTELEEIVDAMSGELGFRYDPEKLEEIHTAAQLVRYLSALI